MLVLGIILLRPAKGKVIFRLAGKCEIVICWDSQGFYMGGLMPFLVIISFLVVTVGLSFYALEEKNAKRRDFLQGTTGEMVADLTWKNGRLGLHAPGTSILVCSSIGVIDGQMSLEIMDRVKAACAEGARRLEVAQGADPVPSGDMIVDTSGALSVRILDGTREICSVERATGTIHPAQGDHLAEFEAVAPACAAAAQKLRVPV